MTKNFVRKQYDVAGQTTVTVSQQGEEPRMNDFSIHANRDGIWFTGVSEIIDKGAKLDELAKQIAAAWKASKALRPKLLSVEGTEL